MKKNKCYEDAMLLAKENLSDVEKRGNEAIGDNALEFMDSFLTEEEKAESNLRVAVISEIIKARKEKNISQKKLEKLSGIKQPIIARMEIGKSSPRLETVLKMLVPMGKTLVVAPLRK